MVIFPNPSIIHSRQPPFRPIRPSIPPVHPLRKRPHAPHSRPFPPHPGPHSPSPLHKGSNRLSVAFRSCSLRRLRWGRGAVRSALLIGTATSFASAPSSKFSAFVRAPIDSIQIMRIIKVITFINQTLPFLSPHEHTLAHDSNTHRSRRFSATFTPERLFGAELLRRRGAFGQGAVLSIDRSTQKIRAEGPVRRHVLPVAAVLRRRRRDPGCAGGW